MTAFFKSAVRRGFIVLLLLGIVIWKMSSFLVIADVNAQNTNVQNINVQNTNVQNANVLDTNISDTSILQSDTAAGDVPEELRSLYAQSAILMDGNSGRVLFEKNGYEVRPMASTTKIMTCILALELGKLEDVVEVSAYAASQPDVQLQIREGEQYYLGDLLYSLMLKSHNDTAVAIAEHIGGSIQNFAYLMNQKAEELGARNTYFITPNGLDETDAHGTHSTTAYDLARIMAYAIKNPDFVQICQTQEYGFREINGKRNCLVTNSNSFLHQMDGVIAGKTGFTADAGYCYVCALEDKGRTYIVTLLACGWPNHKTYKWSDTKKLFTYGLEHFQTKSWENREDTKVFRVPVNHGKSDTLGKDCLIPTNIASQNQMQVLAKEDEKLSVRYWFRSDLAAPLQAHTKAGEVWYCIDDQIYRRADITTQEKIEKIDFGWCMREIYHIFTCRYEF